MLHQSLCGTVSLDGEPIGKKWTVQNREGHGGWGQGQDVLLCNRGELQTLNVKWKPQAAAVYQATVTRLCSSRQLCISSRQRREDCSLCETTHFLSNALSQQRKKSFIKPSFELSDKRLDAQELHFISISAQLIMQCIKGNLTVLAAGTNKTGL